MRFLFPGAVVSSLFLALAGCGGGGGGGGGGVDPSYAHVEGIVLNMSYSCTAASCHGGASTVGANLNMGDAIDSGMPITTVLNNKDSCEYPPMKLVDPGHPENSWLMIKVDPANADAMGAIQFTPDPSFDPTTRDPNCPPAGIGTPTFGVNMPNLPGVSLTSDEVESIRQWIANGAPGM